ncbi:MGMT family protein [Peredibacter sp. HCB2-198]|uniref:MGMT family protein n=1 Tax=Peredibacter sp. HCB2-198 TaxID=3383025 RepID=UPI0038B5273E
MAQTEFTKKVIATIKKIPKGKVATYAQIAKLAGKPQGVRGVVWILHSSSTNNDLPWFRVINAKGKISFPEMSEQQLRQKALLVREGIEFGDGDVVDLKVFQWKK